MGRQGRNADIGESVLGENYIHNDPFGLLRPQDRSCYWQKGDTVVDEKNSLTGTNGLVERVKGILMKPRADWPVINDEPSSVASIYKSYVLPLAAIGPVATLIHALAFGQGAFGISYRPSFMSAVSTAVISYLATLVVVYLLALLIDFLAPKFEATPNRKNAFKVAAYNVCRKAINIHRNSRR